MASGGSKRWRVFYHESTTYEALPKLGWKHLMAESRKWKQNMAGSTNAMEEGFRNAKWRLKFAKAV
jgi:hypothetical protein